MLEVMENNANCTDDNVDWHVKDLLAHAYFQSSIIQYEYKIMESNVLTVEKDFPDEEVKSLKIFLHYISVVCWNFSIKILRNLFLLIFFLMLFYDIILIFIIATLGQQHN